MGRALKAIGIGAAIIGIGILTGGISFVPSVSAFTAGGVAVAGASAGLATTALGGVLLTAGASQILGGVASVLSGRPRAPSSPSNSERLRVSIDPRTPRKAVFGSTAGNTDIRDEEFTGDQEFLHRFIVVAAHKVHAIRELWFDDEIAWSVGGGVASKFAGYLTVTPILEGSAANAINISPRMGSTRRYTGCAYLYVRYKLTGNSKKAESPFAQGITGRVTIRTDGQLMYDPRQDSTVPGGSGAHRANNQATWTWGEHCRNPAVVLLAYLLGWRINDELSVGAGIPTARIDLESFATAANICDESVSKPGGGTEPRYRCDGTWSEGDDPSIVLNMLKASMNADLDDMGGQLRLTVFHNDLATPVADFTDSDILGDFVWTPVTPIEESFNIVRGGYTDASNTSLYQMVDYPQQELASADGIDRIDTFNLPIVQSAGQAQRLAGLRLRRNILGGTFVCELNVTGWRIEKNSIIRLAFSRRGWVNKLFRVAAIDIRQDGIVPVTLREEDPDLYDADGILSPIDALEPTPFDYQLDPAYQVLNTVTRNVPRGTYSASETYIEGDQVVFAGSTYQLTVASSIGNDPPDVTRWVLVAAAGSGTPGADGAPGYSVLVSNEAHVVATAPDGSGGTYTSAGGTMQVRRGASVLSPTFSIAAASPATAWISIDSSTGVYTVTDPGVDLATATLRATVDGINFDRTYTLAKSKQGVGSPLIQLTADRQGFTFTDNAADPASQTVTLTAVLEGVAGPASFSTSPAVALGGSGNTRTLAIADFGSARQVTVTATAGSLSDRITLVRIDQSTAEANANRTPPGSALNRNPAFEAWDSSIKAVGWTTLIGTATQVITSAATYGGRLANLARNTGIESDAIPVTPGERIWLHYRFLTDAFRPIGVPEWFVMACFSEDGGSYGVATGRVNVGPYLGTPVSPLDSWQEGFVALIVPAGKRYVRATAIFDDGQTTGIQSGSLDRLEISRQQPGADVTREVLPDLERGAWASGAVYSAGDVVTRSGSSWRALSDHTASGANEPPSALWALVASAGADGAGTLPIYRRSATQPATPGASAGVPSGWFAATGDVPAGAEPMWVSIGTRPDSVSNWTWPTPTRHEAISAVNTGDSIGLGFATSGSLPFSLGPGQSRVVRGQLALENPIGAGSAYVQLEWQEQGGGWTASNGDSQPYAVGEPAFPTHEITVTNSSSISRSYSVRGTGVRTNTNSGTPTVGRSIVSI